MTYSVHNADKVQTYEDKSAALAAARGMVNLQATGEVFVFCEQRMIAAFMFSPQVKKNRRWRT